MDFPAWLAPYEPQVPIKSLVEQINQIYHSFDACHYDREHPEIHQQLPPIWAEMMQQLPQKACWRIVDLGCGTGFEAQQTLQTLGPDVESLIAYDPAPEMLDHCKQRLQGSPQVTFCAQLEEIRVHGPFNLLLTNSLLHHLPNIQETLSSLLPSLKTGAFWLAGHEPSSRFYRNPECVRFVADYARHRERAKWFEPSAYFGKLSRVFGKHPLSVTAKAALERGLFKKLPSAFALDRLIDFHVAHSPEEAAEGRGLDFEVMQSDLHPAWQMRWVKSYAYFGSFNPMKAPRTWQERGRQLAQRFPLDGANFSTVWSRAA